MAEDLITRYQLDISDLKLQVKQLEDQFKKLTDAEKKSAKEGEDAFNKTTEAVDETNKSTSGLEENLKSLGKTIIAAFAVERIIAFGAESVKAFAEAEQNALKLKTAVGVNGGLSSDYDRLLEQSGELQRTTIFSDDQIQQLQVAALQFGLSADEVEKLTPKIIDFASATGQDLNSAFSLIVAGTNGAVRGLRQYGVSIDEGQTKQQNYIQIVQQLTDKFNGQAEAIGNTTGGTLTKLSNAWDDLKESIGGAIAPAVIGLANLAKGFTELVTPTEKESVALEKQKERFELLQLSITQNAIGTKERTNAIKLLQAEYPSLLANVNAEKVSNEELKNVLNQINDQYIAKIAFTKQKETLTPLLEAEADATIQVTKAQNELQKELNNVIKQSADAQTTRENQVKLDELKTIPTAFAVQELIKGRIKLEGVSSASLTKLFSLQEDYNSSQEKLSGTQLKLGDAQKDYNAQVKILEQLYGFVTEEQNASVQSTVDYTKLSIAELKKLAATNDTLADAELTRRGELSKKSVEQQKQALAELQKIANEENQKAIESTIKTEDEKFRIQRESSLKRAQQLFAAAGGANNLQAVKAYNEAVASIEITYANNLKDYKLKIISEYYVQQIKLSEQSNQEQLQNELSAIETNQIAQEKAIKEAYIAKGDFSKQAEQKLQDDITKIQLDAEKKRADETLRIKNEQVERERALAIQSAIQTNQEQSGLIGLQLLLNQKFQKDITDANAKSNDAKSENDKAYADQLAKLGLKNVDGQITSSKEIDENWIQSNEAKIQAAAQATTEILNFLNVLSENQIAAKEDELKRLQEGFDAEDAEIQLRFEQRLISAAEYEIEQDRIKKQRIATEKQINKEIAEIKRKQDIANRAQAIFEVLINTAVAISKLLATPFLATAAGIAGAAQLAAILATPLPKYAKGTKYLQRGNNPSGTDTIPILANEGERIIPTSKNKKYWSIYEAIDGNKFDEFISNKYVAPALQRQLNDYKKRESISFAENISNSLMFNHDLLASKIGSEIEWRNRNGIKVKGMQDLIDAFSKTEDIRKR